MVRNVSMVLAANGLTAALGMFTGLYAAHALGPAQFGVAGVCLAFVALAQNFLDFRLPDLILRLVYRTADTGERARAAAGILQVSVLLALLCALGTAILGFALALLLLDDLVESPVRAWTLVLIALAEGSNMLTALLVFTQRLAQRFAFMAIFQVASAVVRAALVVALLQAEATIDQYALALWIYSLLALVAASAALAHLWPAIAAGSPWHWRAGAWRQFRGELHFIVWGSFLGYAKLLHRAADVLLVAFFCTDRQTGHYKLARAVTDGLSLVYDALVKVYQPNVMAWLGAGQADSVRSFARRAGLFAVVFTIAIVAAELVGARAAETFGVGLEYLDAVPAIVALTVPLLFIVGVHLWLWPIVVHGNDMRAFTLTQAGAILVLQYLAPALYILWGGTADASVFAAGYAAVYLAQYSLLYVRERRRNAAALPW